MEILYSSRVKKQQRISTVVCKDVKYMSYIHAGRYLIRKEEELLCTVAYRWSNDCLVMDYSIKATSCKFCEICMICEKGKKDEHILLKRMVRKLKTYSPPKRWGG